MNKSKDLITKLIFVLFVVLYSGFSFSSTRTWTGAGTGTVAWAGNWDTDPGAGDDIEITSTGTLIITGMPSLALNSITIHGGSNYTVEFQGANTLTVGGNGGADLVIDASTGFILSATNAPSITMAASATSTINGVYTINTGCTFTMSNASVVNTVSTTGSIINAGTITGATTAKLIFEGVSSYTHSQNGETIPTADWNGVANDGTSTCTVTGMTTTKPGGLITTANTFHHFTWNCAGQAEHLDASGAGGLVGSGENMTCTGNFTVTDLNGYQMVFSDVLAGALSTLTVGGNMVLSNDIFIFNNSTTPVTVNITGTLLVNGGSVEGHASATGAVTLINAANLTVSSGAFSLVTSSYSTVTLTITGDLTVSGGNFYGSDWLAGGSPTINVGDDVIVSGGTLTGSYSSGAPTYAITGDILVTSGSFYGARSTGSPSIAVDGGIAVSGTGVFVASSDAGAPIIDVTLNFAVSAGDALFARGSGDPVLNLDGDLNISGTGRWYGQDLSTGSPQINITGHLNQTGGQFYGSTEAGSPIYTITGNVVISGTASFYAAGHIGTGDPVYHITGDLTVSGGSTTFYGSGIAGANSTLNIEGSVDLSTGTVGACNFYTSTTPVCTFNLNGVGSNNLTLKTGLTYDAGAPWSWNIVGTRTITLLSNVEMGGTASSCIFTNNGTLIMGTYTFPAIATAAASFVNASGATLKTAHLSGLSTTAATGAIQLTGTKTFSSAAGYVFNGAAAQVTGNFGASTTPTASTVANLELNNTSGVTLTAGLTVADAGTLTLTAGYHDLASYTLQVGTTAATTLAYTAGGLYSATNNGSLKRYIPIGAVTSTSANYYGLFPFKKTATNVNVMEFNSTANVTTAGFITATPSFATTVTNVANFNDDHGNVKILHNGKKVTIALTTIAGGTFTLNLSSGNFASGTLSDYTLVTYTGAATGYQGSWTTATGSAAYPTAIRTGIATADLAQDFVMGSYNATATTLPIQLVSFTGVKDGMDNLLRWSTESELNNDFFTVEKTTDGEVYEIVGTMDGVGNSNQLLHYTLTDSDVRQVLNYYRLKQTDFDGKCTYSSTITIDNRNTGTKEISMVTNILGQEVNQYYRGVVIVVYSDGTSMKVIQ